MARSFSVTPVRVLGLKDGLPWFDSRDYPVQFYPPEDTVIINDVVIAYPDFHHANSYGFVAGDTGGGVIKQSCHSFVSIPFQDWGPLDQPGISDELVDEVIGTIPGEADVALVRVKMSRTNAPDQVNGNTVPVAFKENEWVMADGGTVFMEYLFPIMRMMWIRFDDDLNVDGTRNVILSRKQSIKKTVYGHWRAGNSPLSTGWTYGGTNGRYGHVVKSIEAKGPTTAIGGVITYRRGDGAQCSLTDTSDYSSSYEADIEIIPGLSTIDAESVGGAGGIGASEFIFTDVDAHEGASSTHTYTDKFVGDEPDDGGTRHVIVAVTAYTSLQSAAEQLNSVTLDGVTMTQVVRQRTYLNATGDNDPSIISAIYILSAPTGSVGDIVLNFSANFWWSQIDIYAGYNMPSTTPVEILQGSGAGTVNYSLDTDAYGFAVGVRAVQGNPATPRGTLTGFDNVTTEDISIVSPSTRTFERSRGYQVTDSAGPLAIETVETASGATRVIAHAFASFQGKPGKAFAFTDTATDPSTSATHTYASLYIGEEPAANNIRTVMAMFAVGNASDVDLNMGTVTLNGNAMTQRGIIRQAGVTGRAKLIACYSIDVPTGDTATLVFNSSVGNFITSMVDVYALYNLASSTPVDTETVLNTSPASGSINTALFGFGIGLGIVYNLGFDTTPPTMVGFENTSEGFDAEGNMQAARSFGQTDGTAVATGLTTPSGTSNKGLWLTFA